MDGGGNAVGTLRAFSQSDDHSITILDTHQMKERTFKHLSAIEHYRYGEAALRDCVIELIDSKEPTYIYESRAVRIYWDNGREIGDKDNVLPLDMQHRLAESIPNAQKIVFEDEGHGMVGEIPEKVFKTMMTFLEQLPCR